MDRIALKLSDISTLLYNLAKASKDKDIGFEDSDRSYTQLKVQLSRIVDVPIELVESALWASTLLDESGKFEHPEDKNYERFLGDLLAKTPYRFSKSYNTLERKHGKQTRR